MNRILFLLFLIPSLIAGADPLIVGYLPDYRIESWTAPEKGTLTDVIYFGIEPSEGGVLPEQSVPVAHIEKVEVIKKALDVRLLLCVGGWGRSEHFPAIAADEEARKNFIAGLLAFCEKNGFDGVDYDWEHPENEAQMADYVRLLEDTRAAFKPSGLLVTIALASWQDIGTAGYAAVNRVHLMSYDHPFPQATMAQSAADVEKLLANGCPPEKVVLGIPFYGRNEKREARSYAELTAGKTVAPDVDEIDGFAFNGVDTVKAKWDYVKRKKLGGLMVWELAHDGGALLGFLGPRQQQTE